MLHKSKAKKINVLLSMSFCLLLAISPLSLAANYTILAANDLGMLFLVKALTPTQTANIDLSRSTYEIVSSGSGSGGFVSGMIIPELHPELTAIRMLLLCL